MSDAAALERFRLLFEEQQAVVYRFVYAMVADADAAKELTQETFFRAWRAFAAFEARSSASTWLCGIARNVVLNDLRARRRFAGEAPPERAAAERSDGALLSGELRGAIRDALRALDADKRAVFVLKVLEGKSYEEIAAITGSAIAKLKTDLHRARLQLRAALGGWREGS